MKKFLVSLLCTASCLFAQAQYEESIFKPFKFDISAGIALPTSSSEANKGFLFAVEPKYGFTDQFSLGLKFEIAASVVGDAETGEVKASGSYLLTGDYYFTTSTARPFAGVGVGIFNHASGSIDSESSEQIAAKTNFGFAPRVGVEVAHFRAALEYNFAGKVNDISKNYLGIKLGVVIGGGRRDY